MPTRAPEAKDNFLQCCCWGPRRLCGIKRTVAGRERTGGSKAMQCCCCCPMFRCLLGSPRHFCSFPRKPELHGKGSPPPLPSEERVRNGSTGHRATLPGPILQHLAREGKGEVTPPNSPCSPQRRVVSAPLKAPICLPWLYGRVGAALFAMQVPEARRLSGSSLLSRCLPAPGVQGSERGWALMEMYS